MLVVHCLFYVNTSLFTVSLRKTVTTTTTTYEDPESDMAEQRLLESAYTCPVPEVSVADIRRTSRRVFVALSTLLIAL